MLCPRQILEWEQENSILKNTLGGWEGRMKYDLKSNLKVKRNMMLLFSFLPRIIFFFFRFHISLNKLFLYRKQYILLPSSVAPALSKELLLPREMFFLMCVLLFCMLCLLSFTFFFSLCVSFSAPLTLHPHIFISTPALHSSS